MKFVLENIENRNKIYFWHSMLSVLMLTDFLLREEGGGERLIKNFNLQTGGLLERGIY